jgi:hypothetical protein
VIGSKVLILKSMVRIFSVLIESSVTLLRVGYLLLRRGGAISQNAPT